MNKRELAKEFAVSITTIDRWLSLGCPVSEEGRNGKAYQFDPEQVQAWRDDNIMPTYQGRDSDNKTPQEIAAWGLDFAQSLLYYVEKCKHCRKKMLNDVETGVFGKR